MGGDGGWAGPTGAEDRPRGPYPGLVWEGRAVRARVGAEATCTYASGSPVFSLWCWGVDDLGSWGLSPMKLVALHFLGKIGAALASAALRHSLPQRPGNGWVPRSAL